MKAEYKFGIILGLFILLVIYFVTSINSATEKYDASVIETPPIETKDNITKVMEHYERALRARNKARTEVELSIATFENANEVYEQAMFNLSVISE